MKNDLDLVEIDGSQGEGGGQVLRSALTLSTITGKSMRITRIRSGRKKPGLRPQHLAALDAAAAICGAEVSGAAVDATEVTFHPREIRSGRYRFNIGTAGAATLVLQTVFLPLSFANSASSVLISGGTHVAWSPSFHFLDLQWLPYLQQSGFDASLTLDQAGFYPAGGGRISATIRPVIEINPLIAKDRGELKTIKGISAVANLPTGIAERQKRQTILRLQQFTWPGSAPKISVKLKRLISPVKGTFLLLLVSFTSGRCCYIGIGEIGKPAERVADEAVDSFLEFMETDSALDQYLADQILLPLCFARKSSVFTTSKITNHLLTNADVINSFLPDAKIQIDGELGQPGQVFITPTLSGIMRQAQF